MSSFRPLALASMCLLAACIGCGSSQTPVAKIKSPHGKVEARQTSGAAFAVVKDQDPLPKGGVVRTGEDGTTAVVFTDNTEVTVNPESFFEVGEGQKRGKQEQGTAIYKFQKQSSPAEVETPHGVTAVLGTIFMLQVASLSTTVVVEEGKVSFTAKNGAKEIIEPGQKVVAKADGTVSKPVVLDPGERDALFNGKSPLLNQR